MPAKHSASITLVSTQQPAAPINASAVATPDAAGVVDPRRAFILRDVFAQDVTRRLKVPVADQQRLCRPAASALNEHA